MEVVEGEEGEEAAAKRERVEREIGETKRLAPPRLETATDGSDVTVCFLNVIKQDKPHSKQQKEKEGKKSRVYISEKEGGRGGEKSDL